ncbi:MAG: nucleotidyl transferase AbiEii/AbiGii toxin family protein [Acidobacteria bacterium]|nr:nucleotidyl transferase AbiEii/AbiGii toxin family protein [Acidobacteriota bacterium]
MNYDAITKVLEALERENVRYTVFGGAALNFHGLARFTEDVDLFIQPDRLNIEALKRALFSVFHDPNLEEISADDLLGDYPAVQYVPPEGDFHIDILTRLGEAFRFEDLEVVRLPHGDLTISVVSPRTLYRMKLGTVRAKDRIDAESIRERFGFEEK